MSRVRNMAKEEVIGQNKNVTRKSTFFRVLTAVQIGVLIIGILLFLAWCGTYFIHDSRTEDSSYGVAEAQTALLQEHKAIEDIAEHKEDLDKGMLPKNIIPHHYNLTLQLFMPPKYNFTTKGNVEVLIECIKETKVRYNVYVIYLSFKCYYKML